MIKLDIVNRVAETTKLPKVKAEIAVEAFFQARKAAMRRGERMVLRGAGVFEIKQRKVGIGRNPRTGEAKEISPGKTVRFKPGLELRQKGKP